MLNVAEKQCTDQTGMLKQRREQGRRKSAERYFRK